MHKIEQKELSKGVLRETYVADGMQYTNGSKVTPPVLKKDCVLQILDIKGMETIYNGKSNCILTLSDGVYKANLHVVKEAKELCKLRDIKDHDVIIGTIQKLNNSLVLYQFNIIREDISHEIGSPEPLENFLYQE